MIDLADYGVVYGTGITNDQKAFNAQALRVARDNALLAGGTEILIGGKLYINAPASFDELGQTTIGLCGTGMLSSGIFYQSNTDIEAFFDLRGTSYFHMRDLTIGGGLHSAYGLYCGRNVSLGTAGKHSFQNVRVVDCTKASYLNFGSEGSVHIGCQFQRSPIGAIVTGYPMRDNVEVKDADLADWSQPWVCSTSHFFYGCSFGDSQYASRCGLMICGSVVYLFGGMIQAKRDDSEAYVLIDGTWQMVSFTGVHLDSGLADVGLLIGQYAPAEINHQNRISMAGCHISISPDTGQAYIRARNLQSSNIGPLSVAGPTPDAEAGFELDTVTCANNVFSNCRYRSGAEIEIYSL